MANRTQKARKDWPQVLTQAEAAEFLRCSIHTVRRLTNAGGLRPYRIGQRPRFPLEMLRRYVASETGSDHAATA